MSSVVVAGAVVVPFRKEFDGSVDELGAVALRQLRLETGINADDVDEVHVGSAKGGSLVGQRSLRFAGLAAGLPVFNVENACASSAVAFHVATDRLRSGRARAAVVLGVEQLSVLGKGTLPVQETEWDGAVGVTNPIVYAMRATRYMHEFGAEPSDMAAVTVKSRGFAASNDSAQYRTRTDISEVLASRPVADPLTLLQCSAKSDGAAALLLMTGERASALGLEGPVVRASEVRSGVFSMAPRDILRPDITERTAAAAYEAAGVGPDELDVVELHDAFSIAELLYTEELGLCGPGEGADLLRSGRTSSLDAGSTAVVNPSGGLLSRGHPIGATGAAQIAELTAQLTDRAGPRQRQEARTAMAHVTGGGASGFDNGACVVTILSRD